MKEEILISDAAKEVCVEPHVLRYWEVELDLTINRNEWGRRFYTKANVEIFKRIKSLRERGLQLKAIKMLMVAGKLEAFERGGCMFGEQRGMAIEILSVREATPEEMREEGVSPEEEAAEEKDREQMVGGSIDKERFLRRDETYFRKIDQLLRDKSYSQKKKRHFIF